MALFEITEKSSKALDRRKFTCIYIYNLYMTNIVGLETGSWGAQANQKLTVQLKMPSSLLLPPKQWGYKCVA